MSELPDGTITFLFTDIEGSTALWDRDLEAMDEALVRHDALLRGLIEQHGGRVFKSVGDGFHAAFTIATNAIEAALAAQRSLQATSWGQLGPIRVRMALLTGGARIRDEDYFGPTLNRISRLLSVAHGGQILLGSSTAELVRDVLPTEVTLRDLGEHSLRDLKRPEHVFQIVAPGLMAEHPPIGSIGSVAGSETMPVENGSSHGATSSEATSDRAALPEARIAMLGRFQIRVADVEFSERLFGRRKALQLFKCLLSQPLRRMTTDSAIELFWPRSDPSKAEGVFRSTAHAVRHVLKQMGVAGDFDPIVRGGGLISIAREVRIWVDADAFEALIERARDADDPYPLLEEAEALYAGPYLPEDRYEEWTDERRRALERMWVDLQLALAEHRERRGNAGGAIEALDRLMQANSCDEHVARLLMQLLARHGRRADALRLFRRLEQSLRAEDIEPSDETLEVRRQVASGGTDPVPPVRPAPAPSTPAVSAPPSRGDAPAITQDVTPSHPFPVPTRLLGRTAELAVLGHILERGRESQQIALVAATAGTGKSALVGAVVRRAQRTGAVCLVGGGYEQAGAVPLAPVHDALADFLLGQAPDQVRPWLYGTAADVLLVVPELRDHLGLPSPSPADAVADRARLFQAVHAYIRSLTEQYPVLLCIEDLHAADTATLGLIEFLARQLRRRPFVILGTLRSDEVQANRALGDLLTGLRRENAERIDLQPLDRENTARLAAMMLDGPPSARLSDSLYDVTDGNPLFVEQWLLALREEGKLERLDGVWDQTGPAGGGVPTRVPEVIGQRLERLSLRARATLAMAAVLGQSFEYGALLAAIGPDDESALLEDLDEAVGAQILREAPNGFSFQHAMLRETVYAGLSSPRRMLLHARAGQALEGLTGADAPERAAELAHHFYLGGQAAPIRLKTIGYSLTAGRHAAALSSYREALTNFARAGELIERDPRAVDHATHLAAVEGRMVAERELALWRACFNTAQAMTELSDVPLHRASAYRFIASAAYYLGDMAAALTAVEDGLRELAAAPDTDDPATAIARVNLHHQQTILWYLQGRYSAVRELGEQMVRDAAATGQPLLLCWAHTSAGWAHLGIGQIDRGVEQAELARVAAERYGQKTQLALAEENLGLHLYGGGRFALARASFERAVTLFIDSANDLRAVNSLRLLARVELAEGNLPEARHYAGLACGVVSEDNARWLAECDDVLGAIATLTCEWEAAQEHLERAVEWRERMIYPAGHADSLMALGLVHEMRGDWARALDLYAIALQAVLGPDRGVRLLTARRHYGRLLLRLGHLDAAAEQIDMAVWLAEEMSETIEYAPAMLAAAELALSKGELLDALAHAKRAQSAPKTADVGVHVAVLSAILHAELGMVAQARDLAEEALQAAQRIGGPHLLGLAHLATGQAMAADGDERSAVAAFLAADQQFVKARTPYSRAIVVFAHRQALDGGRDRRAAIEESMRIFAELGARPLVTRLPESLGSELGHAVLVP